MIKCVDCGELTQETVHERVTGDACPHGHGVWFSPNELLDVVRSDTQSQGRSTTYQEDRALFLVMDRDIESGDPVRDCPMCRKPLNSVRYALDSDVIIDACPVHGVWLDAGELEQLEAWKAEQFAADSLSTEAHQERLAARERGDEYIEERLSPIDVLRGLFAR